MKMKKLIAGMAAAVMLAFGTVSASAANTSYVDVGQDVWYAPAVGIVSSHGLMSGVGGNAFAPYGSMSRAMVVQVLYNQAGKPKTDRHTAFSDVGEGVWYYDAVQWAAQNQVASGVGNGKFAPDNRVTRQEFAVFLYRYTGSPSVGGALSFVDASRVSDWAKSALLWANQNGIINGAQNGSQLLLNPTGNASRAEAAKMLSAYLDISNPGHNWVDHTDTRQEWVPGTLVEGIPCACGQIFPTKEEYNTHTVDMFLAHDPRGHSCGDPGVFEVGGHYKEVIFVDYQYCSVCGKHK